MEPTALDYLNSLELDVIQMSCGNQTSAVLTSTGAVYRWGRKVLSGDGKKNRFGADHGPMQVEGLRNASLLACRSKHMMAVTA